MYILIKQLFPDILKLLHVNEMWFISAISQNLPTDPNDTQEGEALARAETANDAAGRVEGTAYDATQLLTMDFVNQNQNWK